MSLNGAYDADNIFARIVRGDIPSAKIFEDDQVLAFMDAFPQTRGHCLVISKTSPARNLLDADAETAAALIVAVQRVARAVVQALKPDGLVIKQFNGAPAGQTIFHLHFHIMPVWAGQAPGLHGAGTARPADLADIAARIAAQI